MIKKTLAALCLTVTMIVSFGVSGLTTNVKAASVPSYSTVTEVEDWGATITKVIVNLGDGNTVSQGSIGTDTFKVHVEKFQKDGKTPIKVYDPTDPTYQRMIDLQGGDRTVTKAYVSDKDGNPVSGSNYVTLELKIAPDDNLCTAIYAEGSSSSYWAVCDYTITQEKDITNTSNGKISGIVSSTSTGGVRKIVDDFKTGSFTNPDDKVTLTYSDYTPAADNKKNPLIIWLHGMGEGGTDPTIPIAGNKADNFASSEMQSYFGGAYVLAPQTPTYWMDGLKSFGDGTSKYEKALMALIKDYVSKHNDVDPSRVYLGGDSNGGYMTMVMMRDYGNYFAAAMPTCEALADNLITDSDIQKLKNYSIWFTASKSDMTVPVDQYINPTYDRLIKAGAKDVHRSLFDKVLDTTGLYSKPDGSPYEYYGHFSWIYVYNNQCTDTVNGKNTTIMEWLASHSLKSSSAAANTNTTNSTTASTTSSTSVAAPKTGDNAPIAQFSLLMMASAAIGYVALKKKKTAK